MPQHNWILLIILVFCSSPGYPNSKENPAMKKEMIAGNPLQGDIPVVFNYNAPDGRERYLDTSYSYDWYTDSGDTLWKNTPSRRSLYKYDCKQNLAATQEDRKIDGIWQPGNLTEYFNNSTPTGRQELNLQKVWSPTSMEWVNVGESSKSYDHLNRLTEDFRYHWNTTTAVYEMDFGYKFHIVYNPDSTLKEEVWEVYSEQEGMWVFTYRRSRTYTEKKKILTDLHEYWDTVSVSWRNNSRIQYYYDFDGELIMYILWDLWDTVSGAWKNNSRTQYYYDFDGELIMYIEENWDEDREIWLKSKRTSISSDPENQSSTHTTQQWDSASADWINYSKYMTSYNDQNNLTKQYEYKWDRTSSQWWIPSQHEVNYDEWGNLTSEDYVWRESQDEIDIAVKAEYQNDTINGIVDMITEVYYQGGWSPEIKTKKVYADEESLQIIDNTYQGEELCVVTVSTTGNNLVVWEKTPGYGTIQYNIYRETNIVNDYELIGTVAFDSPGVFVDENSNPRQKAYKYKITALTECEESQRSFFHKSIHLQINPGINSYNLNWTEYKYEGGDFNFLTYNIYRGTEIGTMEVIGSVSGLDFTYTDTDPPDDTLFYQVAGVLESPCYPEGKLKAGTGPYSQAMSNLEDNKKLLTLSKDQYSPDAIRIYPNPLRTQSTIIFSGPPEEAHTLRLIDISGQVIREKLLPPGTSHSIEKGDLLPGFYIIEIRDSKIRRIKIIVE